MRPGPIAVLAFTLTALGAPAGAQTAPLAAAASAPRFLPGYGHPDLTQCQTVNAGRRECTAPANVGGRYLIEAAGFATSTAPDATLAMNIIVGEQVCIMQTGAKFTGRGYLHLLCETTLATDAPIKIAVNLASRNATLDAEGPKLVIRGLAWDGVVSVRGTDAGALPIAPPAVGTKPAAKPGH